MKGNQKTSVRESSITYINTPTPRSLRKKMVTWREIGLRLMREFPEAGVGYVRPLTPLNRRALLDCPSFIADFEFEIAVLHRARELEHLALTCNQEIKLGVRRSKVGWQQAAA